MAEASISTAPLATSPSPLSHQSEQGAIDLIWDLLDCDRPLTDLNQWPRVNAVALHEKSIPPYHKNAGPVPLDYTYVLVKDPRRYSVAHCVDRASKYMNGSSFPQFHTAWINIIHAFLVIYRNGSRPTRGRNWNRINAVLKNLDGFNLLGEDLNV